MANSYGQMPLETIALQMERGLHIESIDNLSNRYWHDHLVCDRKYQSRDPDTGRQTETATSVGFKVRLAMRITVSPARDQISLIF